MGGPRVGGACGPMGASGVRLFERVPAPGPALLERVALGVHLQAMNVVDNAVEERAGEALASWKGRLEVTMAAPFS